MAKYKCYRTRSRDLADRALTAKAWAVAPRSEPFVDVVSGTPALYDTQAAMLWDDTRLYAGFWCDTPFVEAHVTERDELVCVESDVEVFFDGGDTYYELQLNARNTVYEVLYIWKDAYERGGRFDVPELDVRRAMTFAGNADARHTANTFWTGTHPRGNRWTFFDWDLRGLQTAVRVEGTLNDPETVDVGWTAEIEFPWAGMHLLAGGRALPPKTGDVWRIFLARYEKFRIGGADVSAGWSPDAIGSVDNHQPERFMEVVFSDEYVEDLEP